VTGIPTTVETLLAQSERVYNFQKVFAIRMGRVGRKHDYAPYRAMGPVTTVEYESRQERYDGQLQRLVGIDPTHMSTAEKVKALRQYREAQYEKMMDAVYERRGWDRNSIPTVEKLKALSMDLPELLDVVEKARKAVSNHQ
jgi:aldehyde:ferredoxin oxidoreductase